MSIVMDRPTVEKFDRAWPVERQIAWVQSGREYGATFNALIRRTGYSKESIIRMLEGLPPRSRGRQFTKPPRPPVVEEEIERLRLRREPSPFRCGNGHWNYLRVVGWLRPRPVVCLECVLTGAVGLSDERLAELVDQAKLPDLRGDRPDQRRAEVGRGFEGLIAAGVASEAYSEFVQRRARLASAIHETACAAVEAAAGDTSLWPAELRDRVHRAEAEWWAKVDRWERAVAAGHDPQLAGEAEGLDPQWVEWAS